MNPIDVLLNSEPEPELAPYQVLLFRRITDVTEGLPRAVYLEMVEGRPAARSLASLQQAWTDLVLQHNGLIKNVRRDDERLVTPENWREFNVVVTPYSWFRTKEFGKGQRCPEAFSWAPSFIKEDELVRWNKWLHGR